MTDLIVYFHKPADWADTVRIHYWDAQPGGRATNWPGTPMTAQGDDWFAYRFEGVTTIKLVFNDNQGRQTSNLSREGSGYYRDEQWFEEKPAPLAPAVADGAPVAASKPAPSTTITPAPAPTRRERGDGLGDFREETIYFLLTARFYEGDPSNSFFLPRPHQV